MLNFFKKNNASSTQSDPFAAFGMNKKMMVMALKQMKNLNTAQKQQIKMMFKKQVNRSVSREEATKGAEELAKHLTNDFSPAEMEQIKKDLVDLFTN